MVIVTNVTVNSFYSRHCRDLKLVSSLARVKRLWFLFARVFNYSPFYRGVRYTERGVRKASVDCIYTENTVLKLWAPLLNQ